MNNPFDLLSEQLNRIENKLSELDASLHRGIDVTPSKRDEREFITLKQVCELTGYAAPTIYGLIGKNTIPHFKRGQRLFFERDAIVSWIREGKRKSKAEIVAEADSYLRKRKAKK